MASVIAVGFTPLVQCLVSCSPAADAQHATEGRAPEAEDIRVEEPEPIEHPRAVEQMVPDDDHLDSRRLPAPEQLYKDVWVTDRGAPWFTSHARRHDLMLPRIFGNQPGVSREECLELLVDANAILITRVDEHREHVHIHTFLAHQAEFTRTIILGRIAEVMQRVRETILFPIAYFKVEQLEVDGVDHARMVSWAVRLRPENLEVRQYWFSRDQIVVDINVAGNALSCEEVEEVLRIVLEAIETAGRE